MNLNKVISDAIAKGAGRVVRKPLSTLRRDVAALKRQVAELKREVRELSRPAAAAAEVAAGAAAPALRPTGPMVRKVRARLGLTQAQLAKLAGVSALTVCKWEKAPGRLAMRGRALEGFARARGLRRREAADALKGGAAGA